MPPCFWLRHVTNRRGYAFTEQETRFHVHLFPSPGLLPAFAHRRGAGRGALGDAARCSGARSSGVHLRGQAVRRSSRCHAGRPGAGSAFEPAFSHDGRWLAFLHQQWQAAVVATRTVSGTVSGPPPPPPLALLTEDFVTHARGFLATERGAGCPSSACHPWLLATADRADSRSAPASPSPISRSSRPAAALASPGGERCSARATAATTGSSSASPRVSPATASTGSAQSWAMFCRTAYCTSRATEVPAGEQLEPRTPVRGHFALMERRRGRLADLPREEAS